MMNMNDNIQLKRLRYVDFIKFISLTGIFLAHVNSPNWVMMLRSFDVPCMVILSAVLAEKSYKKRLQNKLSFKEYFISRFKRLVIPTWIFLSIYFGISYILGTYSYSAEFLFYSFCLTRYGIGYVWVILIFLYCAIIVPLLNRIKLSNVGVYIVFMLYVIYEIAFYFQLGIQYKVIDTTFYYIIPYGLLAYLGYNYNAMKERNRNIILLAAGVVFLIFLIYYWVDLGKLQPLQIAKYPPRLYFLSYGVFCSYGLLLFGRNYEFSIYNNPIIKYISMHSLWIYLWHIITLTAYNFLKLPSVWYVKFIVVYSLAIMITWMINIAINLVEKHRRIEFFRYFKG